MNILETLIKYKDEFLESLKLNVKKEGHQLEEVVEKTELPGEYARRFTLHPIDDPGQVLAREEELTTLQKAYDNWKITKNCLLIVGESGSGMTSLMNANLKLYEDVKVIENKDNIHSSSKLMDIFKDIFQLEEVNSIKDIPEKLDKEVQRVIIFENIERLFLRKVHGFHLLEDFLLLMHATKDFIYWIVTINKFSLYYLDQTYGFSPNFLSIIKLPPFPIDYLKEVILQRNSGYEILYLKPENPSTLLSQRLKQAEKDKKQSILEEAFFTKLYSFSDGNISRSILFWKNSVIRISEKRVYVKAYEPKPIGDLSLDDLFILEAILQHTSLSSKELQQVLRHSSKGSVLSLATLMEKSLIHPKSFNDGHTEYQINLLQLKSLKNLLHSRLNRNIN